MTTRVSFLRGSPVAILVALAWTASLVLTACGQAAMAEPLEVTYYYLPG